MKGQKERRAPNLRGGLRRSQTAQGGAPGKKSARERGGAGAQSGATGVGGKSSPR
jgi:hypothetical protein